MAQPIAVSKPVRRAVEVDEGLSDFSTQEMYREILAGWARIPTATACSPRRSAWRSRWPS